MKALTLVLAASILSLSFTADAQQGEQPKFQQRMSTPVKGYYSIGNNAAKLNNTSNVQISSGLTLSKNNTTPEVKKGYYATGNNKEKLGGQITLKEVNPKGRPASMSRPTKGYYSIGNNAEKL